MRPEHPQGFAAAFEFAGFDGVAQLLPFLLRHTQSLHRAHGAIGLARQAHGGAQIHQGLGVAGHGRRQGLGGQQFISQIPQHALVRDHGQVGAIAQHAGQDPFDVAIQNGGALAKAKRGNGRRGGSANARQTLQIHRVLGKDAAKTSHHLDGAAVQIARAAVVTQPTPQTQHLVLRRAGQGCHIRKLLEKTGEIIQHRAHLRLLQHDLGQPHTVRIAGVLPRQAVAAMAGLPGHHVSGKTRQHFGRNVIQYF